MLAVRFEEGKVVLRDVLGDDPPQENSLVKLTVVEELEE